MSGTTQNTHMYGAATGNAVAVTDGGNVSTSVIYDNLVNVGRVVLRNKAPYQLPDCPAAFVKIMAAAVNVKNVFLGGINAHVAQADVGYPIVPGATVEIPVTNSNQLSLMPVQDGDTVYIVIGAVGNTASITPGSPGVLDVTPPSNVSTVPVNGLSGQPINTPITALFDRALDPSTVNNTNVTVVPSPAGLNVVPDSGNPANVIIMYTGVLPSFTIHTVTISNMANVNGYAMTAPFSWSFTTSNTTTPPSTTPPTITSTNPTSGATKVPTSVNPTITFSQAILATTVTTTNIQVIDVAAVTRLTGYTLSQSGDLKTVTINGLTLANSKQYRIDVYNTSGTGIENTVGIFLDNTYSITFTTVAPATIFYNVSGNTYSSMNAVNAYLECGESAHTSSSWLINRIPVTYTFVLQKVGNPSGNFLILWRNGDSFNDLFDYRTLATIAANTMGTSDTTITVNDLSNTVKFQQYDAITVRYNFGTTTDYLKVKCASPDAANGSDSCLIRVLYDHSASVSTTADLAGTIGSSN